MRFATSILVLLFAIAAALPTAAAAASGPKVAVIVGPAGEATDRYRERAEAAARVAERHTPNVVRVYSPNATWPAVREAIDGAAIVIYLGHGNGWPSKYRDAPYGVTQNGFGLNPVAGGGDDAHQYFGEDRIAAEVNLAKNAVVLLHHLCYASGNTEPGLPEGTIEQSRQRVDNYAAGFIRAGAGAVVAEAHIGPAWYVEQLFERNDSIDRIWRSSPTVKGHESTFESIRSKGFVAAMDPDRPDGGFYRSIVYRGGVGGGRLAPASEDQPVVPADPTLVGTGLEIGAPYIKQRPLAGSDVELWLPYVTNDRDSLDGLTTGARWDPIDVPGLPEPAPTTATEDGGGGTAEPAEGPPDPSTGHVTYIEPERVGDVVEPVPAAVGKTRIRARVTLPAVPGRYRLVTTLHDAQGVAFDAASQELMPSLIVHVSGELGVRYLAAPTLTAGAGAELELPVGVANVGSRPWGQIGSVDRRSLEERPIAGVVHAHWVPLETTGAGVAAPAPNANVRLQPGLTAGGLERVVLALTAPESPGSYLLVIDVVVPGTGSLTAHGSEPGLVRITVE